MGVALMHVPWQYVVPMGLAQHCSLPQSALDAHSIVSFGKEQVAAVALAMQLPVRRSESQQQMGVAPEHVLSPHFAVGRATTHEPGSMPLPLAQRVPFGQSPSFRQAAWSSQRALVQRVVVCSESAAVWQQSSPLSQSERSSQSMVPETAPSASLQ
jgi:hypothetical protein